MILAWSDEAWDDYIYWQTNNKIILKSINSLIKEIKRTPYEGKGNPEPLKYELSGYWSRRITLEHRLVYTCDESTNTLYIVQCRYHY
ncbi:MAG: Txe/YoeB family addiction module toxin [Alcaligenaceae bacterium]|nr:Txe/YoeB family addiction module toxin [Alcaligenaceae bacterium]